MITQMPFNEFMTVTLLVAVVLAVSIWLGNRAVWRWEQRRALRRRLEELTR